MLRDGPQRAFKIWQVQPVVYTTITHDVDGQETVLELGQNFSDEEGLVNGGTHGDGVVAWVKDEVGEERGSDEGSADVVGECYVAL